jgi:putative methionine-R-sulfoxide reductase with GAF domain
MAMHGAKRDYKGVAAALAECGRFADEQAAMQRVVDALWAALSPRGVSWLGFYLDVPGAPDDRRLVLGPHRDRPACSPIGVHGACGNCLLTGQPIVVRDVAALGEQYIACDPRDQSEVVVPVIDEQLTCWAVLDLDSFEVGAFTEDDVDGLRCVLAAAGLGGPEEVRRR